MAFIIAFTICAYPFICAKKAEAIAPAVGAAAAAAALAAELGITTEALMTGLMVVTVAGTGVYLLQSSDYATSSVSLNDTQWRRLWDGTDLGSGYDANWNSSYQKWKLGNGKSWEDLTPEERQNWDSPAQYDQSQLLGYALETGLISEIAGGGGFEPTPEPDPNTDPEGHARWQKARNVLYALAVTGGAVALNDAVGWLGNSLGKSIHDLLFGSQGLDLKYVNVAVVDGINVPFATSSGGTVGNVTILSDEWVIGTTYATPTSKGNITIYAPNTSVLGVGRLTLFNSSYYRTNVNNQKQIWFNDDVAASSATGAGYVSTPSPTSGVYTYLNLNYAGGYDFYNGSTLIASYRNGEMTGADMTIEYGQIADTPNSLASALGNGDNNTWNTYINNASVPNSSGQVASVTVPQSWFTDALSYDDFVIDSDASQVTPVPDDEPIYTPSPEPEPEPGLSPDAPEGFEDDMTDSVNRILRNPIDQVFPFCLIADFRDLIFILLAGDTDLGQNTSRLQPNSIQTQSDTPTDELNGVNRLYLDFNDAFEGFEVDIPLEPVHDLLIITRLPVTILFILALVYETFGFFLKRGGE